MTYLDAASSEPLHPAARAALLAGWKEPGGYVGADVRRLHHPARRVRVLYDQAREMVAAALGVRGDEVVFTSSGTAAIHTGLLGLLKGRQRAGQGLVVAATEHAAVRRAAHWSGSETVEAAPDRQGVITPRSVRTAIDALSHQPALVAVQSANHEVGTIQPLAEIAEALGPVPLFVDACASMGRLPLPEVGAVIAGSAHKWGGPPGVGVLVIRKGVRWRQALPGDDRAHPDEVGYENVIACHAAAVALSDIAQHQAEIDSRQRRLTEILRRRFAAIADSEVAGHPLDRLPHIVSASFLYVDGEALVTELDRAGFAVASGSACASSSLQPSAVLAAMGVLTHGNLRVSLSLETTETEVIALADAVAAAVPRLRARVGL